MSGMHFGNEMMISSTATAMIQTHHSQVFDLLSASSLTVDHILMYEISYP